jgi:hypothetical protein
LKCELLDSGFFDAWHGVGIELFCDGNVGLAQEFRNHSNICPRIQYECCERVSYLMSGYAFYTAVLDDSKELMALMYHDDEKKQACVSLGLNELSICLARYG